VRPEAGSESAAFLPFRGSTRSPEELELVLSLGGKCTECRSKGKVRSSTGPILPIFLQNCANDSLGKVRYALRHPSNRNLNLIFSSAGGVLLAYPTVPISSTSVSGKCQKYWSAGGHFRQDHVHIQRFTLFGQNLNQVLRLITRECYLNFELQFHCIWQEVGERKVESQLQKISTKGYVCCKMLCLEN
jgi:hypothetical protein